ncbi:MAG: DUF362 domain-containing protein [Candidatus Omnitrophica bacterium]|nr:DUF362 domain-containing protein [Candidatus Omnitrophota bacterium]
MKSDVYFVSLSSSHLKERQVALARLIEKANPHLTFREGEFVPVKITIGDTDCVYHVHPALVSMIIAAIAQQKAKPFLFDTSVIYKGQRQNAIDHLALAQRKGFTYEQTGAPFIVADGVFGNDGKEFTVSSNDIKKVRTPSFVGMVDSLLVLSHATGHIVSGYAGAIKNVAMGMSCRATKQVQHSSLKPSVIEKRCTACGCCIAICPVKAITYVKKKAFIDQGVCVGCGECLCACKFDAIILLNTIFAP